MRALGADPIENVVTTNSSTCVLARQSNFECCVGPHMGLYRSGTALTNPSWSVNVSHLLGILRRACVGMLMDGLRDA